MKRDNYLREITVPIPWDQGHVVIRRGETIEYQLDRTYDSEDKSTRVQRKVIGKVDPVQLGRMFPNEAYFELFPDNEVPKEIRDEFLRECEIKRQMRVVRRSPEEIVDNVVRGMEELNARAFRSPSRSFGLDQDMLTEDEKMNYAMLRRVFDEMYYAIEELAGKYPNEVIVPFKVERINEVLEALRESIKQERGLSDRPLYPFGFLRLVDEGLTYSDVMLILKWYKVLPR